MRLPCVGGPCIIGPVVGSALLSIGTGMPLVSQTSWKIIPGTDCSSTTVGSGPLLATIALPSASCPVTTRWIGGKDMERLLQDSQLTHLHSIISCVTENS